ncbi:hypothetical protein [Streptomyces sp. H27-S2]|uniref:hypothetical protein n=1 Tax=Streptomyces antarcticus TaxID=2996458 RepID=UPI00226FCD75|nr:hypothetical protein [Streptomyces sp. H27-S2]MCY0954144.1 hypothetical protein [Streptomyces sp. H27-S2]
MVMVTEVLRKWRMQRCVRSAVVVARAALPTRSFTAVPNGSIQAAPEAVGLGGDELRVRAWLMARLDGAA